jgi:hypothetical protein
MPYPVSGVSVIIIEMFLYMKHTASRGTYNMIEAFKIVNKIFTAAFGKRVEPAIGHRLSATGLI